MLNARFNDVANEIRCNCMELINQKSGIDVLACYNQIPYVKRKRKGIPREILCPRSIGDLGESILKGLLRSSYPDWNVINVNRNQKGFDLLACIPGKKYFRAEVKTMADEVYNVDIGNFNISKSQYEKALVTLNEDSLWRGFQVAFRKRENEVDYLIQSFELELVLDLISKNKMTKALHGVRITGPRPSNGSVSFRIDKNIVNDTVQRFINFF